MNEEGVDHDNVVALAGALEVFATAFDEHAQTLIPGKTEELLAQPHDLGVDLHDIHGHAGVVVQEAPRQHASAKSYDERAGR
jgi:hypothetical protein